MSAVDPLELARVVTHRDGPTLIGVWPRAAALLARQAVEDAMTRVLAVRAPGAERCANRPRLLCLREYVPDELAERTAFLWATLSRACHHHPYELSPNADEINAWIGEAEAVVGELEGLA
ncbi:MAG: hypothetical protein M5U27_05205 [Gaiella sp.]|nr:hypothetical protein [Gaiella sp.]